MLDMISNFLTTVDDFVWGIPLIVLILATGLFLTARLHFLQITKLPHAIKHLIANEKSGEMKKAEKGRLPALVPFVLLCLLPSEPVISLVWQRLL